MSQTKPKHHVMIFRFSGMKQAYAFEEKLKSLGLTGLGAVVDRGAWVVQTDTRCLAYAGELYRHVYAIEATDPCRQFVEAVARMETYEPSTENEGFTYEQADDALETVNRLIGAARAIL